jgi:collagenase-like PrtC family protease
MGAVRIVMARECSLEEIKKIRAKTDLKLKHLFMGQCALPLAADVL